jgi:hypothetical protein
MNLRRATALVFVWYFLVSWTGYSSSFTQVGPFATQAACNNYQAEITKEFNTDVSVSVYVTSCFSTTAK